MNFRDHEENKGLKTLIKTKKFKITITDYKLVMWTKVITLRNTCNKIIGNSKIAWHTQSIG